MFTCGKPRVHLGSKTYDIRVSGINFKTSNAHFEWVFIPILNPENKLNTYLESRGDLSTTYSRSTTYIFGVETNTRLFTLPQITDVVSPRYSMNTC